MKSYVADFETTTKLPFSYVWAYAISDVSNIDDIIVGTSIDEFMEWCEHTCGNDAIYFHNLKFDSQFIMYWLFKHDFTYIETKKERKNKTFTATISDKGLYYTIDVYFKVQGKRVNKVTFKDSLKLIPLSVDKIAKSLKLPFQKLSIDYDSHNDIPAGTPLTDEEIAYIKHDVKIVAYALNYFFSQGLDKLTIGACALDEYKKIIDKKMFERYFPVLPWDADIRPSYRGGFTYVNPDYAGKQLKEGIVFDVNSLYPSVMDSCYLPYKTPIMYKGKYEHDDFYPLYIQILRCQFRLKKGKIPTIQIKDQPGRFKPTEYLTSSGDEEATLCLTSVDLELFLEHYDVFNMEYIVGFKFMATVGLFSEYIKKWSDAKIQAKLEKNHGLYLICKLMLNNLYGKYGTSTELRKKIPYLGEDDVIHFDDSDIEKKDGIYVAMASFITAYARDKTIRSSQRILDNNAKGLSKAQWIYSDTDSMHIVLNGESIETFIANSGLDIDDTRLGAWKFESKFTDSKFLRTKCYLEMSTEDIENPNPEYELKVTCAGMPKDCHSQVTFKNFKIGATYKGKKQPKIIPGGVILKEVDFTIKKE